MSYPANVAGKFALRGMDCFSRLLRYLSLVSELVGQHHDLAVLTFSVFCACRVCCVVICF